VHGSCRFMEYRFMAYRLPSAGAVLRHNCFFFYLLDLIDYFFSRCSILDNVSRRPIVLLNTSFPDAESGSTQK
jgi:hypothetical protein